MTEQSGAGNTQKSSAKGRGGWLLTGGILAILAIIAAVFILTRPAEDEPTIDDPKLLLQDVIGNLRELETFRLLIEQSGAPYVFWVTLDEGSTMVSAEMERADAQYETPNILYASTRLRISGLPALTVEIFARGIDQWFKLIGTDWINYPVAEGFDPGKLIQENGGFPAALAALSEVSYKGLVTMADGSSAYHITGLAGGNVINDLMFGLLSLTQEHVQVDVYIDRIELLPSLLLVTLPNTATESEPENTVWRIETYDFNGEAKINYPDKQS